MAGGFPNRGSSRPLSTGPSIARRSPSPRLAASGTPTTTLRTGPRSTTETPPHPTTVPTGRTGTTTTPWRSSSSPLNSLLPASSRPCRLLSGPWPRPSPRPVQSFPWSAASWGWTRPSRPPWRRTSTSSPGHRRTPCSAARSVLQACSASPSSMEWGGPPTSAMRLRLSPRTRTVTVLGSPSRSSARWRRNVSGYLLREHPAAGPMPPLQRPWWTL
mmetsp:Transcript_16157/g.47451  ORF Transcript_16157/g.47451 Transcript_16157/m.47451 type:complete len:216 (+) Transcript_16157:137-784(+)